MNPPLPLERPTISYCWRGTIMEVGFIADRMPRNPSEDPVLTAWFIGHPGLILECTELEYDSIIRACADRCLARWSRWVGAVRAHRLRRVPLARDAGGAA